MAGFPARCLCKVNLYNLIFLTLTVLFYKFHNYKMNKSWQSETAQIRIFCDERCDVIFFSKMMIFEKLLHLNMQDKRIWKLSRK